MMFVTFLSMFMIMASSEAGADSENYPYFRSDFPMMKQIVYNDPIADQTLECKSEGYFVHPDNCSQFYRCVDYLGSGQFFSRYVFNCPSKHVFIMGKDTCVPGTCSDAMRVPVAQPVTQLTVSTTDTTQTLAYEPVTNEPSTTSAVPTTSATTATSESTTETLSAAVTTPPLQLDSYPVPQECGVGLYQQHHRYCNVYHPCDNEQLNYACDIGSAFDFHRQACRLDTDGTLCMEKEILTVRTLKNGLQPQSFNNYPQQLSANQILVNSQLRSQDQFYRNDLPDLGLAPEQQNRGFVYPSSNQIYTQGIFNPQVSPLFFQDAFPYYNNAYYNRA